MNKSSIIIIVLGVVIIGSIIYFNIEPKPDSKRGIKIAEKARAAAILDSTNKANKILRDSIAKVRAKEKAAEEAYKNRPWKLDQFVDEFGDPSSYFIKYSTIGRFSNSAASGEDLYVDLYVTKRQTIGVMLYEYNRSRSAEKPIGSWVIQMKNQTGEILRVRTNSEWNQTGGALIKNTKFYSEYLEDDLYASQVINFFKRSVGKIKVIIDNDYSSRWSFEVDVTGFSKEYARL